MHFNTAYHNSLNKGPLCTKFYKICSVKECYELYKFSKKFLEGMPMSTSNLQWCNIKRSWVVNLIQQVKFVLKNLIKNLPLEKTFLSKYLL